VRTMVWTSEPIGRAPKFATEICSGFARCFSRICGIVRGQAAMPNKRKLDKQKEAANFVARLILDSLDQFPEKERNTRLNDIHKVLQGR
jgi:hypothetical protein